MLKKSERINLLLITYKLIHHRVLMLSLAFQNVLFNKKP